MSDKLKPCPFCGGEAHFGRVVYPDKMVKENGWDQCQFSFISCAMCGGSNRGLVGFRTNEEAAEHWNKRHVDWHPVSEPPEEDGWYFVTVADEDFDEPATDVCKYVQSRGFDWNNVTSWMPLPEPYQPEGE